MWSLFREHMKICELRNVFMHTFLCWFRCLSASRRRSYFYIHIAFQTVTHRLCRLRRRFMHKTAKIIISKSTVHKNRVKFLWLLLSRSEWNLGQMHFLQFFSFLFCIFWVCYFRSRGAHKKIKKKKKKRRKLHCRHSEERKVNEPRLIQFEWGTFLLLACISHAVN